MPFLRFSRDKRGYENTYLCHTYRSGGNAGLRVLYWFRTPPDVKVGRLAIDPSAIRAIEENNPDLKFDWGKILKVKPPPPPPDYGREGREERRARRRRSQDAKEPVSTQAAEQKAPPAVEAEAEPESAVPVQSAKEQPATGSVGVHEHPAVTWEDLEPDEEPHADRETTSTHVVLGLTDEEGLVRLRARHAEIQARISDRFRDPGRLEELRAQAAALDPDAWQTVEEARERLASLDEATEAIRKVLGRRRRTRRGGARRRRRRGGNGGEAAGTPQSGTGATPDAGEATAPAESDSAPLGNDASNQADE